MTSVGDDSSSLASKCLDLCQTLASQGQAFIFSLIIGSTFNFSMTTGSQDTPAPAAKVVKKKKEEQGVLEKEVPTLPSSTLFHLVKGSTHVTLTGLDVDLIGLLDVNSTNPTREEVKEEAEDDTSDEDDEENPINY